MRPPRGPPIGALPQAEHGAVPLRCARLLLHTSVHQRRDQGRVLAVPADGESLSRTRSGDEQQAPLSAEEICGGRRIGLDKSELEGRRDLFRAEGRVRVTQRYSVPFSPFSPAWSQGMELGSAIGH